MPQLTIFTAPKPFTNPHISIIQRNAIQSWLHLGVDVEVFLVGEEEGMNDVTVQMGVKQLMGVKRNDLGTPLTSSIFSLAREASQSPLLAYLNADILITPDFVELSRQVAKQVEQFLIVGQRWDLEVTHPLSFNTDWVAKLERNVLECGKRHPPQGSDFFIFPRQLFVEMPGFAIGRAGWDNWMIFHARRQGWPVIDVTGSLLVIHQAHDYSHLPGGKPHYTLVESEHNIELAGGQRHIYTILDTDKEVVWNRGQPVKIRRHRPSKLRLIRFLEQNFTPSDGRRQGWRWSIARRLRRWRRSYTDNRS
jgi:hypothetical protein